MTNLSLNLNLNLALPQVTIPFLLLHGAADTVTDPAVSQALYQQAASSDKTFKLYPDVGHPLPVTISSNRIWRSPGHTALDLSHSP